MGRINDSDSSEDLLQRGPDIFEFYISIFLGNTMGGGPWLHFGQGHASHSFKMEPLARPIWMKMIPLARLISTLKVPNFDLKNKL